MACDFRQIYQFAHIFLFSKKTIFSRCRYMESKDPTVFTKTYEEGVERVLKVMEQDLDLEKDILRICILERMIWVFSPKKSKMTPSTICGYILLWSCKRDSVPFDLSVFFRETLFSCSRTTLSIILILIFN